MEFFIGIDGGGTKTEIVVADVRGNIVSRDITSSSNPNDIGTDKTCDIIINLLKKNVPSSCTRAYLCAGISGCNAAHCENLIVKCLKEKISYLDDIHICSDVDISCACMDKKNFCTLILGTGSVAIVKKDNSIFTIGGGGYLIDDDLSGFSLGRQVLNAVLCAEDGRAEKTILSSLFYKFINEDESLGFRHLIKNIYDKGKKYIASFAPLVFDAFSQGDRVAENILSSSVRKFEKLLYATFNRFNSDKCDITLFGGLTKKFDIITNFLSRDIKNKINFLYPSVPIIYGAFKLLNIDDEISFRKNFILDYNNL